MSAATPTDQQIIDYARTHYGARMAAQVQAAIRSTDNFGAHVRRSFVREMHEPRCPVCHRPVSDHAEGCAAGGVR